MGKFIDLTGQRFGRWSVLHRGENKGRYVTFTCQCECGTIKDVRSADLKNGKSKSCGCLNLEKISDRTKTHGRSYCKIYKIWQGMKNRCLNANDKSYNNYGGRGINVCDDWLSNFESFYKWSILNGYKDNLSIDRINNEFGYSPDNCRWTDMKTQANNRRTNRCVTINGTTKTFSEWCNEYNISPHNAFVRVYSLGWDEVEAITTPIQETKQVVGIYPSGKIIEFNSAKEAGEAFNTSYRNITRVCHGDRKTCKGIIWKYKDNYLKEGV